MILNRLDTQGVLVHGGALDDLTRTRAHHGAIFRLAIEVDGGTRDASAYLNPEGCIAVARALLEAARWALPGGVEGCDDRRVREAAEALHDRAVMIERLEAGYGDEVAS